MRIGPATVLLAALGSLSACAPRASNVRGTSGEPLPTTARLDDDHQAVEVHCPDGYTYAVVESRTRALASFRVFTQAPVTDTAELCARIRRY